MTAQTQTAPLSTEPRPIASLRPHPKNPRRHPEHQLAILRDSLRLHGQQKPVVIQPDGTILAGHGLVEAAKLEGWQEIAVHVYDGPHPEAFVLMDNRSSDLAEDDATALLALLQEAEEAGHLLATGYGDEDLLALLAEVNKGKPLADEEQVEEAMADPDAAGIPTRVQPGDLWQLGRHRLLCGDATDPQVVARLLQGQTVRLVATDPPYGVAYDGNQHRRQVSPTQHGGGLVYAPIANDDLEGEALERFLCQAFTNAREHAAGDAAWYVWHASITRPTFLRALSSIGVEVHAEIVWVKENFQFGRADYHWQHEPCLYGWGEKHVFLGERNQSTVWDIPRQTDHEHPTTKPVELWRRPVENHLQPGEVVYDPFLGSGPAIMAAEQLGRVACGCELEPRYADVIVARWEGATGQTASKLE